MKNSSSKICRQAAQEDAQLHAPYSGALAVTHDFICPEPEIGRMPMIYSKIAQTIIASILLGLCNTASALRSTDFESYTDPDYKGYVPKKIILLVANTSNEMRAQIEKRLKEAFKKKDIVLVSYRELFPPTRAGAKLNRQQSTRERKWIQDLSWPLEQALHLSFQ